MRPGVDPFLWRMFFFLSFFVLWRIGHVPLASAPQINITPPSYPNQLPSLAIFALQPPVPHLFVECRAWTAQRQRLWRRVGKDCGWEHPRAPAVRRLWDERATEAVLEFLKDTRVGFWTAAGTARRPAEDVGQGDEGEEGGPGPPRGSFFLQAVWGRGIACGSMICTGSSVLALVSFVFP